TLYDEAIDGACKQRFVQDEAIANERAGRYYREEGRARIAAWYLSNAANAFGRWGATEKVRALEEEFPDVDFGDQSRWCSSNGNGHVEAALDVGSILRAGETIASEVVLDRLLEKLLEVCITSAGAERGALLLEEQGHLVVRAQAAVTGPSTVDVVAATGN